MFKGQRETGGWTCNFIGMIDCEIKFNCVELVCLFFRVSFGVCRLVALFQERSFYSVPCFDFIYFWNIGIWLLVLLMQYDVVFGKPHLHNNLQLSSAHSPPIDEVPGYRRNIRRSQMGSVLDTSCHQASENRILRVIRTVSIPRCSTVTSGTFAEAPLANHTQNRKIPTRDTN